MGDKGSGAHAADGEKGKQKGKEEKEEVAEEKEEWDVVGLCAGLQQPLFVFLQHHFIAAGAQDALMLSLRSVY